MNRRLVLASMCVALATVVATVSSLNVALPDLARDLHATQTELQWVVDAYAVVFAGLLLLGGALGDAFGRRYLLLGGLAVFSAAACAAFFASDPSALIAVRTVMGVGAAAIMPATLAIITNVFPAEERDRAVAIWAGVAGGSALLGVLAAGALLEFFSWASVFGFSAVLGALAFLAGLRYAPNSKQEGVGLDVTGGLISAAGLLSLVYGIIEGPERGWTDPLTLGAFVVGVLLLAAFVVWELRREEPLLDPRLFKLRGFSAGTASITAQFFSFFGFIFVTLQYVQFLLGYSPLVAGLALAPLAVAMMALSPRVPKLVNRFGPGRVGPLGLLAMAAGYLVLSGAGTSSSYWLLLACVLPLGIGMALATTPATTAIVNSLPKAKQGVASAVNDLAREVGGALGIAVLGSALTGQYKSGVETATHHLPPELATRAEDALPAALAISHQIGAQGAGLAFAAENAFVDGLRLAMIIAAASVALIALFVFWRAPRTATTAVEEHASVAPGSAHATATTDSRPPHVD